MLLMHEAAGPGSVPSWLSFVEHHDLLDRRMSGAKIVVAEVMDVLDEGGSLLLLHHSGGLLRPLGPGPLQDILSKGSAQDLYQGSIAG